MLHDVTPIFIQFCFIIIRVPKTSQRFRQSHLNISISPHLYIRKLYLKNVVTFEASKNI